MIRKNKADPTGMEKLSEPFQEITSKVMASRMARMMYAWKSIVSEGNSRQ